MSDGRFDYHGVFNLSHSVFSILSLGCVALRVFLFLRIVDFIVDGGTLSCGEWLNLWNSTLSDIGKSNLYVCVCVFE